MGYMRIMVQRQGYAIVKADTEEQALEAAMSLSENDFDWESVDGNVLADAEVVEKCGPCGEPLEADAPAKKKTTPIGVVFFCQKGQCLNRFSGRSPWFGSMPLCPGQSS